MVADGPSPEDQTRRFDVCRFELSGAYNKAAMPGKGESGAEDLEYFEREGYLEVRMKGTYALERFKRQISFLFQACKDRGFQRMLADVRAMITMDALSTLDRYAMGEHAARVGGRVSVAMLGLPAQFDAERFGAQVAQNRGMKIRTFTDPKKALDWLTSADAAP